MNNDITRDENGEPVVYEGDMVSKPVEGSKGRAFTMEDAIKYLNRPRGTRKNAIENKRRYKQRPKKSR
tara:strand:+ start:30938 stop:31141 length:204 start_codon:yes stop_codon:yes gene_type:complete